MDWIVFPHRHILEARPLNYLIVEVLGGLDSLVTQMVKNLPAMLETYVHSTPGSEDPLGEEMATHSSILARIPEFHGQRSLAGCSPWGWKKSVHDWVTMIHSLRRLRWGHKGGILMMGLVLLCKWAAICGVAQRWTRLKWLSSSKATSFLSTPCADTARRWQSASQKESSHQILNLLASPILDFSGSRIVRNNCLPFKPPSLWYWIIEAGLRKRKD